MWARERGRGLTGGTGSAITRAREVEGAVYLSYFTMISFRDLMLHFNMEKYNLCWIYNKREWSLFPFTSPRFCWPGLLTCSAWTSRCRSSDGKSDSFQRIGCFEQVPSKNRLNYFCTFCTLGHHVVRNTQAQYSFSLSLSFEKVFYLTKNK